LDVRTPVPPVLAIVVESEVVGPAIVGLPGEIAALEDEFGGARVADDKDQVALGVPTELSELAEVDPAQPVPGND
jgi:hypothetical protein